MSLAVALTIGSAALARAQDTSHVNGFWATGGVGVASTHPQPTASADLAGELGLHVQRDTWTGSLRYHFAGGLGDVDERALSPMIGLATRGSWTFASFSVGPSFIWRRDCLGGCGFISDTPRRLGDVRTGAGLMLAGDVALRVPENAGVSLGLTGFVNANSQKSFLGVALEIGLGVFR